MMRFQTLLSVGLLLVFSASGAYGTTVVYGSVAAFNAATSGNITLDFNSTPVGPIAGNAFQAQGFIFSAPGGPLNIGGPDFFSSTNYLNIGEVPFHCCDGDFDALDIQIVGNYQAFAIRIVDSFLPGGAGEFIDVYDQNNNLLLHFTGTASQANDPGNGYFFDSFFGVTSDVNIGRIVLWDNPNDGDDVAYDDLQLANPGPANVPEPATLLLLGSGLIGLAGSVRRRLFS